MNYYNDCDEKVCHWAEQLIERGLAPAGVVDCKKIEEIRSKDLSEFTQCHFFSGILGWPYALQLAGWPTSVPVWTGSCPCQPFSSAGKGQGAKDKKRALWPDFRRLIAQCRPPIIFGEQVASKAGRAWLAGIRVDLEGMGYAVGAADLCAAGVGAPHLRQRLFWVAYGDGERLKIGSQRNSETNQPEQQTPRRHDVGGRGDDGGLGNAKRELRSVGDDSGSSSATCPRCDGRGWYLARFSDNCRTWCDCRLGNSTNNGSGKGWKAEGARGGRDVTGGSSSNGGGMEHAESDGREQGRTEPIGRIAIVRRCETGFWEDADYLWCSDGKYRPVEPGTFPLAHGVSGRVAQLRGLGNAIVPQLAAEFIRASVEALSTT